MHPRRNVSCPQPRERDAVRAGGRWRLCAYAAGLLALVAFASCKKDIEKRYLAGDPCDCEEQFFCLDGTTGALCKDKVFEAVPCKGPLGCRQEGPELTCDSRVANEGDLCLDMIIENNSGGVHRKRAGKNHLDACTLDHQASLVCKGGKFVPALVCKGEKHCRDSDSTASAFSVIESWGVACDVSLADPGDRCTSEAGAACSTDGKAWLACNDPRAPQEPRREVYQYCTGPGGCSLGPDNAGVRTISCDVSSGIEGAPCTPFAGGPTTCSRDGSVVLACAKGALQRKEECRSPSKCVYSSVGTGVGSAACDPPNTRDAGARGKAAHP